VTSLQKPRPRVLTQQDKLRTHARQWRDASLTVRTREHGRCRICGDHGTQAHHLIYRSHGGRDEPSNLIWTCLTCHRLIHAHVLLVTYDPARPAATVRFTRSRQWD